MIDSLSREASRAEATSLLARIPGFGGLSRSRLDALASALDRHSVAQGDVVVREGERDDRLFVIVEGSAEVSLAGKFGQKRLAALHAGDSFGLFALMQPDGARTASVTAQTDLELLSLDGSAVRRLMAEEPGVADAIRAYANAVITANFISQIGPFVGLDNEHRLRVAERAVPRSVRAGDEVVRQGELGESCFILRAGAVRVTVAQEGSVREVATLGPGDVFGETALLTTCARTATVTATEHTELLELHRSCLSELLATQKSAGAGFVRLMRLRERPRQRPGIEAVEQDGLAGEKITILKDPVRLHYFRLSQRGRFVWDRLDGRASVRELTLEYLHEFREFAPQAVTDVIGALARAGFVELGKVVVPIDGSPREGLASSWATARRLVDWRIEIKGVDGFFGALYERVGPVLYSRSGLATLALVALLGATSFVAVAVAHHNGASGSPALPFALGLIASVVLHEMGHALTTKHFGRTIPYAGIGWYWFTPVAFIDTSDMWLRGRAERMAVTAAGPCADLVTGAVPSILALALPAGPMTAALWAFALPSYVSFLLNLDPLLEYDGYYLLADYVDRPNLRQDALARLRGLFPRLLRSPRDVRGHVLDLVYAAASLVYVAAMSAVALTVYRMTLSGWIESMTSAAVAAALSYLVSGAVVLVAGMAIVGDLRSGPAGSERQA